VHPEQALPEVVQPTSPSAEPSLQEDLRENAPQEEKQPEQIRPERQ
jgi:hypothetical protein